MLSVLLLVVMVVSMLPVSAYADSAVTYTQITSAEELVTGQYVMVTNTGYAPGVYDSGWVNAVAVSTPDESSPDWTITVNGDGTVTLMDKYGASIAPKGGNNNGITKDYYNWAVTCTAAGTFTFSGQGDDTVTFASNKRSANNFRAYKNATVTGDPNGYPSEFTLYKIEVGSEPVPETVATPTASPAAGEIAKGTAVSFACATEGAAIYYKTTGEYQAYTAPVTVDADTTFTVIAKKDGMNDSAEATFAYTVKTESTEKPWKDVAAKYSIYELVDAPQDGDVVLIYNPGNGQALSSTASGYYLAGDAQTPTDNYIKIDVADTEAVEWTVGSGTESSVTFTQGDKKLSALASGDYFNLSTDPENKTEWLLGDCNAETSTHYVYSRELTGGYGNVYIEWYAKNGAFSAYCTGTDRLTEKDFGFAFYTRVREGVKEDVPPEPEYDTIAEALAGAEGTSFTVKGVVTLVDGKNIFIQDETGGICAYMATKPTDISLGDTIIATGSRAAYKGLPQLSGATYEKSSGLTLTAKPTTIGALTNADVCTYVQLTGLEITEVYDNNGKYSTPNITVKDAEGNTIQLYKAIINKVDGAWEYAAGDKIDVTVAVGINNTTLQLRNTLASEIKLTPKTQYAKLTDTLADGDQFVIYYNKDSFVMTETVSGKGLAGTAATPAGDFIPVTEEMSVLTAAVDADGNYTFTNAEGKFLTSGATGNSLSFADAASDYSLWTLKAVTGGFHIVNVNAEYSGKAQAIEVFNGVITTFSEKDTDYYLFNLYKLTDEEPPADTDSLPKAGDQVVIYNASAEGVIGLQDELGVSMSCVPATIEDGKAIVGNGGRVFTVSVSSEDYSFESNGLYLAANDAEELFLTETLDDYAKWNLEKKTDGYVMYNKAAAYTFSGGGSAKVCIEYFSGSFSGWTYKSADSAIFEMNFYPVADDTPVTQGIVNKPAIVFGALPEAYVGQDYTFTFTVDAVFGVDGTPSAQVMLNTPQEIMVNQDGETYRITVPARFLEGLESLTVHVTALDTLGTCIEGDAVITILDEPVFSDLTPTAGSQTGEDKRPLISAKVANAGEDPTITMTVNGEDVIPSYNEGLISYMAESEMEEGRTTVSITVKRADGKEATKSWSFTVGTAKYQLYFGQLHSHTTYSDGSGTLDAALDYVKNLPDSANVDFVAFTDHSNYFDKSGEANPEGALYDMSLATAYSQETWKTYKDTVAAFNASQSDIVAIAGFEMTWSGGPGHINTFNTPGIVSRNNSTLNNKTSDAGLQAYYALLSQPEGADSLSQLNHPGSTFGTFSDFNYWNPVIDSRVFLVEVGNGEGQVGAGGYYPSYEYYTMALDKGWHVAPSNNQDNHKGKWGNANDARDVILTDDFSEQGIYDAIRAMHMYSTEDKNLEITYTVNDYLLGSSIVEVPEKLNISVTVNDPDASDSISKVEVIVNSGKTVHTWNDPAELATGALSVELDPDYSYYYIRVTEGDGDLAVTAPVWVGESLKLGISALECGTSTPVTGEELTLTTTLFNGETADATVKSITYTTNGSEVLGTDATGYTVPASGTLAVDFKYTPDVAKVMTVTATVVMEQNGKEYTFTKDIELDVLDADSLVYIGIDASHHNEYVAGNYKDSMGNFGALAASYSARTVQLNTSDDLIAACSNPKFQMLILTAPSRRDGTALRDPYDTYSEEEIAAITEFNSKGGTVVLCGWGDYYESYKEFPAEDHMAAQQNKILVALGSSLRISDDETKDDTWNGGQAQRLYLSSYNFASFLLSGVEYDAENPHNNLYTELYSQYGGASIYTVGGTIPATVTPVVYGFDTTYSSDDDGDNYGGLGSIPKYNFDGADRLMVMATEELPGKGLIVVSGAAFLSNFEVQATISDNGSEKNYSNYKICENLLNYINPVTVTDIATVRAQKEAGFKYTIEGVVTSNASGYDKDTAFFDCIYVQDATGGICCFPVAGNFKVGDKVRITGTTDFFQGEPELQVSSIELLSEDNAVTPTEVTAAQITDRSAEGKLVTLNGVVVSFEEANGLVQTIMVRDAAGNVARVFIDGYITTSTEVENLALGAEVSATGLASYDDTFNAPEGPFPRIRVRDRADVVCVEHEHSFGEWTVTTAPTCTEDGVESRGCFCGEMKTRPVEKTGHKWGEWETVKKPTDYLSGRKERVCSVCGEKETEKIPALKAVGSGDDNNILFWVVTLTVSGAGAAVLLTKTRKKYKGMHE